MKSIVGSCARWTRSPQCPPTTIRCFRFLASMEIHMRISLSYTPSASYSIPSKMAYFFCSPVVSSISTNLVSLDCGTVSQYTAASISVFCALMFLYPFDHLVSMSLNTLFDPPMRPIKNSKRDSCIAQRWSFEYTCLGGLDRRGNHAKNIGDFYGLWKHVLVAFSIKENPFHRGFVLLRTLPSRMLSTFF